uniref:Bifunctional inhibitor/plant lipid transfer protein/seed storage helical domain-containing protein n=1 Tax=Ananas comosus var. bracteatus TaxID=296719 RepID=A0A6V7PKP6_ANACO|nr:unnamed protein product [Ananas comosus var. bracteatus]
MAPSLAARRDLRAPVSPSCCAVVHRLGRSPRCLCAVMLSNTGKSAGIKPQVAMTIPKRCNLADRPVGYKYGGGLYFTLKSREVRISSTGNLMDTEYDVPYIDPLAYE